jgi:hypothetical protein
MAFLGCKKLLAQNDAGFPLSVAIKIEKEYAVKLPKEYFTYWVNKGRI